MDFVLNSSQHAAKHLVWFSLIQSTHDGGMDITTASVLLSLSNSDTQASFCNASLKSSLRVCALFMLSTLHQTFMCSYIIQVYTVQICLHLPAAHPKLSPPPKKKQIHTCTHKYTHMENTALRSSGNSDETCDSARSEKRKFVVLISHLRYKQLCDSSVLSDKQPDPWDVLAPCGHRLCALLSLFREMYTNSRCSEYAKNLRKKVNVLCTEWEGNKPLLLCDFD